MAISCCTAGASGAGAGAGGAGAAGAGASGSSAGEGAAAAVGSCAALLDASAVDIGADVGAGLFDLLTMQTRKSFSLMPQLLSIWSSFRIFPANINFWFSTANPCAALMFSFTAPAVSSHPASIEKVFPCNVLIESFIPDNESSLGNNSSDNESSSQNESSWESSCGFTVFHSRVAVFQLAFLHFPLHFRNASLLLFF
jgi:hypothetical protein